MAWQRFKSNRAAVISAWFLAFLLLALIAWPVILKISGAHFAQLHNPDQLSDAQFSAPSLLHWFGTDLHGRDLFSRVLFGAQISLLVGVVGALVSLVIGVLWGAVAGYLGGRVDSVLMRIVDVLYSLPSIIFVMVLITTLGEVLKRSEFIQNSPALQGGLRVTLLFVGLGAVSWLTMARIVRGQVLSLRTRAFVEASRALGGGPVRILARHIIPNIFGVVITYLALTMPAIILYESFLSYLGTGRATADGQLGHAHRRWRFTNQFHPHLLVADCLSRRGPGGHLAGVEFPRRRPARCLGRERPLSWKI